ncbi:hypothetical protein BSKO_11126 [Bryopsis sp. KO-2023]|nr:hypothetical protein BSKO_11126 [Bryopsis sp. KO-2023]
MQFLLALLFFSVALVDFCSSQGIVVPTSCPDTAFFDVAGLECIECGENEEYRSGRCQCTSGTFRQVSTSPVDGLDFGECVTCDEEGYVASDSGAYCVRCSSSSGEEVITLSGLQQTTLKWIPAEKQGNNCKCQGGGTANTTIGEFHDNGVPFEENGEFVKRCLACPSGTYPAQGRCVACPYPKVLSGETSCVCPEPLPSDVSHCSNDEEELTYVSTQLSLSVQGAFNLENGRSKTIEQSEPFTRLLPSAAFRCMSEGNRESCNALANLCTLDVYRRGNFACDAHGALVSRRLSKRYHLESSSFNENWARTMPWLMYQSQPMDWIQATDIDLGLVFGGGSLSSGAISELSFVLSVYSLDGKWLGFEPLTNQFQLCGGTLPHTLSWQEVGRNFMNKCDISVKDVKDVADRFGEPVMYEVFLKELDDKLYPVPILILEQQDSEEEKLSLRATSLVGRFFLVDGVAGRADAGTEATLIRYAQEIDLTIELRASGKIFPPRLTVRYNTVSLSGSGALQQPASMRFQVAYKNMVDKTKSFWKFWDILLFTGVGMGGAVWLMLVYQYAQKRRSETIELEVLVFGLVKMIDLGSLVLVAVLIITSVFFWLITFKFQREVSLLMILDSELKHFQTAMILAAVGQSISLLRMIWRQVHYDVFFVDWEKPRRVLSHKGAFEESAPVSCWRSLFVANEWNELQTIRQTCPELTLLCMIFLLEGLGLKLAANINPDRSSLEDNPYSQESVLLRFGLDVSLFCLVAFSQLIGHWLHATLAAEHPMLQFIDLLFLANISCIILDEKLSGYYLHGRNQTQFSDTNLRALNSNLLAEEEGLVANRGLVSGNAAGDSQELKENQTFMIYLPKEIRDRYERTMLAEVDAATHRQREQQGHMKSVMKGPTGQRDAAVSARDQIAEDFKKLIIDVENNHAEQVLPSTFMGRMLRTPPDSSLQKPILVHDHHTSFSSVLFYGNELRLLIFEMVAFCVLDAKLRSPGLVAGIVFVIVLTVRWGRGQLGERNISQKTRVDRHFLI